MKQVACLFILPLLTVSPLAAKEKKGTESSAAYSLNFDEFRDKLAKKLNDLDRLNTVLHAYKRLTRQVQLPHESWKQLENWFIHKSLFMGSKCYNHALLFQEIPSLAKNIPFQQAYKGFVAEILSGYSLPTKEAATKTSKNITILFTGYYGGGHKAPAVAIAKHFQKNGHKVQLIDVDELENLYSPKVEGYSRAQVYAEVQQKKGDIEKARELWKRIDELQTHETRKYMGDIRKMVASFKADHIFAVAHHKPSLSYIGYQLGCPMTFVHTDHIFHTSLIPILEEQAKLQKPLINFTTLSNETSFLKTVYDSLKIPNCQLPQQIQRQLVRLDFPVRPSFCPVTKSERNEIRDELHIPRHALVCKIAMGLSGFTEEIKQLLMKIIREEKVLVRPLHVFVVCGKNMILQKQLEQLVKKNLRKKSKIHVEVLGFMEEKEMAKIDKASNVWVTKPGGSTSAELLQTQKQMLYILNANHPWEKTNAEYLKKQNLAQELSCTKPIVQQIRRRVWVDHRLDHSKILKSDWQNQALQILNGTTVNTKLKQANKK